METVKISSNPRHVKDIIQSVGSRIGSVEFIKRSTGEKRTMTYRLGVSNPKYGKKPESGGVKKTEVDVNNTQITVYDMSKIMRDKKGKVIGQGAYRTIPLENVSRIVINQVEYIV